MDNGDTGGFNERRDAGTTLFPSHRASEKCLWPTPAHAPLEGATHDWMSAQSTAPAERQLNPIRWTRFAVPCMLTNQPFAWNRRAISFRGSSACAGAGE